MKTVRLDAGEPVGRFSYSIRCQKVRLDKLGPIRWEEEEDWRNTEVTQVTKLVH